MNKAVVILFLVTLLFLVLEISLIFAVIESSKEKEVNSRSLTKAICNENNYCQDYEIVCANKTVISKTPLTGMAVQFSSNWKDPRDKESIENLCD
jgi:hypothetical protein